MDDKIGTKLGHYSLIQEVGVGGLGRVFRAIDERTGKTVAVKILHDRFTDSKKFLGIFHRELLIVSRLYHKNIVSYLDSNFHPPVVYIVTEFVNGFSLYSLFKKTGRLPPLVALSIVIEILQGIDYLHLHDTIHSDLSAPNILINKAGRIMLTDFGLACENEVEDYKNYMIGTPGYYSPEHITEAPIVPQTDLYCVGLILYELIVGQRAVVATTDRKKALKDMKSISFKNIYISDKKMQRDVVKILKACLQININKRAQNAETLMLAVFAILNRYGIRYSRYAVYKYLVDNKLTELSFNGKEQNIYYGFAA